MQKTKVGLIFGGRSVEHEVSVRSAASIYRAIDKSKFEVVLIGIDRDGNWQILPSSWLPKGSEMKGIEINNLGLEVVRRDGKVFVGEEMVDVFFPVIHGTGGEDGSLQGYLETLGASYVGSGVLASAVGMDKEVQKKLLRAENILVTDFVVVWDGNLKYEHKERVMEWDYPVFVKPARLGSSVGTYKVNNESDLETAVRRASGYDRKVLIERAVKGRELEVGVIGNEEVEISVIGEVIPKKDFYDFDSKYIEADGAEIMIPAENINEKLVEEIRLLAGKVYKILECEGMARIDLFLKEDGRVYVNEINTLPGFTNISMFPKLFNESGIGYAKLIELLVDLAIKRKQGKV